MNVPAKLDGLDKLARRLNAACARGQREQDRHQKAAKAAVLHYIEAGRLATEAKDRIPHGEWGAWVDENCDRDIREIQNYMKLYRNRDVIMAEIAKPVSHLTGLKSAVRALAEPRPAAEPPPPRATLAIVHQQPAEAEVPVAIRYQIAGRPEAAVAATTAATVASDAGVLASAWRTRSITFDPPEYKQWARDNAAAMLSNFVEIDRAMAALGEHSHNPRGRWVLQPNPRPKRTPKRAPKRKGGRR
jgi:hypothetical protein